MLPVPPPFRDGNDADSESVEASSSCGTATATLRRPPSALESGRRSSAVVSRARSRLERESVGAGAGAERPKWR